MICNLVYLFLPVDNLPTYQKRLFLSLLENVVHALSKAEEEEEEDFTEEPKRKRGDGGSYLRLL